MIVRTYCIQSVVWASVYTASGTVTYCNVLGVGFFVLPLVLKPVNMTQYKAMLD